MYKINVFTAKLSLSWVQQLEKIKPSFCEFHYYAYTDFEDLYALLEQHLAVGDGALFSGQIPYFFAQTRFQEATVPMLYFDISERDFYHALTELFYEKKIAMDRIAIDFCYEENGYLGIHEWSIGKKPYLFSQTMNEFASNDIIDKAADWHIQLHTENKVDLSFTRVAEMRERLARHNIPFIAFYPSPYAMQLTLDNLVHQLQLQQLNQNKVVVVHILIPIDKANIDELEYRQIALYKAILDFKQMYANSFIVHREASSIAIITTYKHFLTTTNSYTHCHLVDFLDDKLSFPVKIGWGIGNSLLESQEFAKKAATLCSSKETQGYIIENGREIGPLLYGTLLQFDDEKQQHLKNLSAAYDIPLLQLQKIEVMLEKLTTTIVSGELLSTHLGITVRSANRILKQLQEKSLADELPNITSATRGRPKKYYQIKLY
ncbi:hypothetical protein P9B03_04890 [Metasolibacillus meyeri]|uniref:Transcriptional regulator n=1 Tax=Metasolibacillus meyeri TaxID=1071052 RepID=A0AAW9NSK2_9BACL|nr:hypothetical protein [Metasolibacillus meyeri]MEC1177811.1 hypothetical protein [Metasolibacillus meyeri]